MFEKANREKLRFSSTVGLISLEDLWDLPLTSVNKPCLDSIARELHLKMKNEEEISFVKPQTPHNSLLELKFNIVKHIIEVKMKETEEKANEKTIKLRNEKILEIIARKKDEQFQNLEIADLEKMLQ